MALTIQPAGRDVREYHFLPTAPATSSTSIKISVYGMRRFALGGSTRLTAPLWRSLFFQNPAARKRKLKILLLKLKTGSWRERMNAAIALGKMKAKEAISDLKRSARKDPVVNVREAAVVALADIQKRKATLFIVNILRKDKDDWVRSTAAINLGLLKDKRAVPGLIAAYGKEVHPMVRHDIVEALRRIGDHKAVPTLVSALQDKAGMVIREADASLVAFGKDLFKRRFPKPTTENYLSALSDRNMLVRYASAAALGDGQSSSRVLKTLHRAALRDGSAAVRSRAVMSLIKLFDKGSIPTLLTCLKDKSAAVRIQAARAMSLLSKKQIKIPKAKRLLLAMTKNGKEHVEARYYAAVSLAYMGDRRVVPLCIKMLSGKINSLATGAAWALGKLRDKRAVKPLMAALKHRHWEVRYNAVLSLGDLGDARAIKPLVAVAKNRRELPDTRKAAVRSLGNLKAVTVVITFLKSKDVVPVLAAADVLGWLRDKRAVKPLIRILRRGNIGARYRVVKALGFQGDERAVRPLAKIARSKHAKLKVRKAAIEALKQIGGKKAVSALIKLMKIEPWILVRRAAEALGELKDKRAVKPLIAALNHKQWKVRYYAALSLGSIKDKRAIKPLMITLRKDKDSKVRQAAAVALMQFNDKKVNEILRKEGHLY